MGVFNFLLLKSINYLVFQISLIETFCDRRSSETIEFLPVWADLNGIKLEAIVRTKKEELRKFVNGEMTF